MTQIVVPVVSVVAFGIGLWVLLDGNRLAKHVAVAERLMAEGMGESDAMEQNRRYDLRSILPRLLRAAATTAPWPERRLTLAEAGA